MTKKEALIEEFIPIMKDNSPYTHVLDVRAGNEEENCDVVVTHGGNNLPGGKQREETQKIDIVDCDIIQKQITDNPIFNYYYVLKLKDENGELLPILNTNAEFIAGKVGNEEYLLWNKKDIAGSYCQNIKEVLIKVNSRIANEAKSICSHSI